MINSHSQVVCEACKLILNDGVSIVPGYLEASKDGIYNFSSSDPRNSNPRFVGMRNRVKGDNGEDYLKKEAAEVQIPGLKLKKKPAHFCSVMCLVTVAQR